MSCALGWIGTFLGLLVPADAWGGSPRAELLRLVPSDIGFCLLIEDLRGHGSALLESPFVKQFSQSPLAAQAVQAPEAQKLGLLDQFLQQYLKVNATQLRDEILGDALVLAYRPGPIGKPTDEQGLLLVRARDPKLLAGLVERINELQKTSGELQELEEREHAGGRYFRRVETSGSKFYYLHGPVLAFAWQEPILHQVIELDQQPVGAGESPLARQFRLLGVDKPLAALYVNPRAFEPGLEQKAATAASGQATALKALLKYWKALDGLAFSLNLERDLELTAAVRARTEALPPAARRFLASAAAPSELWQRLPVQSMLAAAGRIDVAALIDLLSDLVPEEARRQLHAGIEQTIGAVIGEDSVRQVLAALGPDWGVAVLAPSAEDQSWTPSVVAAVRVQKGDKEPPADLMLWNALQSLATLTVFHQNKGRPGAVRLGSLIQNGAEVKYLESATDFPPGFMPAVTLRDGYLIAATSVKTLGRLRNSPAGQRPASGEIPLLRVSLRQVSRYLQERRPALVAYSARKDQISEAEAEGRLDHLLDVLRFLDSLELTQRSSPGFAALSLHIHLTQPLK